MKKIIPVFFLLSFILSGTTVSRAQSLSASDRKIMQIKEDSLKQIARYMVLDTLSAGRMLAYKDFVPTFLRALKIKNSFYHPFDSVQGISKLYAPDSSFRIFTWYVEIDDYQGWQRGFIQMRTPNGSLKGHVLFDNSDFTESPHDIVCRDTTWIGAVYYNIIKTEHKGKSYYTLFGFDRHAVRSNRKWIEVLTFNDKKEPVFGGPYFSFEEDSIKKPTQYRYSIEYKEEARTFVNYEPDLQIILVDHLISETDEPELPWTFIPDGDYEGFKWQNGKWIHIDKVFNFKLEDGQAPRENPLYDDIKTEDKPVKKGKSGGGK